MAEDRSTTPLLQPIDASTADTAPPPASLDDAIESLTGGTSKAQLWLAFLASLAWVFDAQQTFINVFTDAQPTWHSTGGAAAASAAASATTQCSLPRDSWTWDHPKCTSIISEWDLQCSPAALVSLPASAFFVGCLAGGLLLATLADSRFGRKNMLFFTSLSMSLSAGLTAVSPNLLVYSALRFVLGFSRATVGTNALVLATELVGRRWRVTVGIMGFLCFTLGFSSLPLMAYLLRNHSWRMLYLLTSMLAFIYSILIFFVLKESPRWLFLRGRRDEAIQILGIKTLECLYVMSRIRSVTPTDRSYLSRYRFPPEYKASIIYVSENNSETLHPDGDPSLFGCDTYVNLEGDGLFSSMRVLYEKRWVLMRLTVAMTVGFGIGMVYYGLPLALGNLGTSNLYVSVGLNALSEVPSNLFILVLIERMCRRKALLGCSVMSGVGCIVCSVVGRSWWRTAAEMVAFFGGCSGYGVLLVYSVELFPTKVRNSAVMMVREAVVLGGAVAPVMIAVGREEEGVVLFGMFGLVIMFSGLFVIWLPETRGRRIFDTLEEEEKMEENDNMSCAC